MPTTDVHGHTIPQYGVAGEVDWRAIERLALSIYRPKVVSGTTARAQYVADLAALDTPIIPSASNPVFVWRTNAGAGLELEATIDGTTWRTYPAAPSVAKREAFGEVTVTVVNAIGATAPVTFPAGRFTAAPRVYLTKAGANLAKHVPYYHSASTAGCTVGLYAGDGVSVPGTNSVVVAWHAVQEG